MKKFTGILVSLVLAVGVLGGFAQVAQAAPAGAGTTPDCDVKIQYPNRYDNFVAKDGTATVHFTVIGNKDCKEDVTVASWNAPNGTDGKPFTSQTFLDSKSGTFTPGNYSMTVALPKCFYQIDLLRGLSPFPPGGGPVGGVNYADWQFVNSWHGGAACVTPTPTPTPAPVTPAGVGGPTVLPSTGPGSVAAVFAATTVAGAAASRVFMTRRAARSNR